MRRIPRSMYAAVYQWAVVAGGALTVLLVRPEYAREPEVLVTLVLLNALAEYFPTRLRLGAVSFSYPMAYTAFLLCGTPGAIWTAVLGTALANLARGRAWRVVCFNTGQFALTAWLAGYLSLRWFGAPTLQHYWLPLAGHIGLWYLSNNLLVDGLLWLRLSAYRYADWAAKSRFEALSAGVSFAYVVLMLLLAPQQRGHDPLALTFFFLPLAAVGAVTRLLTNLSRFAHHMETLVAVSALVTYAPAEPRHALEQALSHLEAFDDFRYSAIYGLQGDDLAVVALRGLEPGDLTHARIPVGEGLTGWAARHHTPVLSGDARHDSRNNLHEGRREHVSTLAAIPLVSGGQVLGVLTAGKERSHSIMPEDMRRLTIVANLLAAVLRNFRLAEEREGLLLMQERNRLAREIHDGLAQSLAGAILQMDRLERLIDHDGRAARTVLHHVRETVRENLLELRRSIWGLRPSPLEQQGLVDALRREVDVLKAKGLAGFTEVRMEVRGEQRRLSGLVEDEVFRVAQEGLTNALKHAGAAEVVLALQFQADRLRVTIRDNGRGFVLADAVRRGQSRSTFGLVGMSERADRLGAQFDLQSRPGGGTRLTLEVPLLGE